MDISKSTTHVQQGIIEVVKPEVLAILSVACVSLQSQGDFADLDCDCGLWDAAFLFFLEG